MARSATAVVDASVATKWYLPEADTDAALLLRESHLNGDVRLVSPDLMVYEVANALRYHPRAGSDRLSVGPLRGDPPRSDRQASRLPCRTGLAPVGPYIPVPLCDLGAQFRAVAARAATRRVRRRDPPAARPDLESAGDRPVSGLRMDVPGGVVQRDRLVRHSAPRSLCPVRRNRWVRAPGRVRLGPRHPVLEGAAGFHRPWNPPAQDLEKSTLDKLDAPGPAADPSLVQGSDQVSASGSAR